MCKNQIMIDDIIIDAVRRFEAIVNSLDCERDIDNGYTCTVHADRILAWVALKKLENYIEDIEETKEDRIVLLEERVELLERQNKKRKCPGGVYYTDNIDIDTIQLIPIR